MRIQRTHSFAVVRPEANPTDFYLDHITPGAADAQADHFVQDPGLRS